MNAFWVVLLLATPTDNATVESSFRSAEPGAEATVAYELIEAGDTHAACAAFLEQIRKGSMDPWAYRGAALCAAQVPATRKDVLAVLDDLAPDAPLVLFARGYLSFQDREPAAAEEQLRLSVELAPDLALAWNALGAVVQTWGEAKAAVPLIERALELAPDLEMAKNNLERARLYGDVFRRLLGLLEELPSRWGQLPEPRVPMSGRSMADVLAESTEEETTRALEFISALALRSLDDRKELISHWLEEQEPREIDLWFPLYLAQQEMTQSLDEAALTSEAALQWAATLGRRDVLLFGAGMGANLAAVRVDVETLLSILESWVRLPRGEGTEHGFAQVLYFYANTLFKAGENESARVAYREARELFKTVGDHLGQGNTRRGEADVLLRSGDNKEALTAYAEARKLFATVDDYLGLGNTSKGEADVYFRLGDNRGALRAYREARSLYSAIGDPLGLGNTFLGEGNVLSRQGENEGAMAAYQEAKKLFKPIGNHLGHGNTLKGEADILFHWGNNEEALDAYREAHQLFRAVGSLLGQGYTLKGEAEVLFRFGDNKGALAANREARKLFQEAGAQIGEGDAIWGEAEVLLRLGDNEGALATYRQARKLFQAFGNQVGRGNTHKGEADVLFRLGDDAGALEAYREAHKLFEEGDSKLGQGNALIGEADVLFRLGDNEGALTAYREARKFYQEIGSKLGLGNSWDGEAGVLFRLGDNAGALKAYREARRFSKAVGDQIGHGNALRGEAGVLFRLKNYEAAAAAVTNATEKFQQVGTVLNQIDSLIFEGEIRRRLGEVDKTIQLALEAIDLQARWREGYVAEEHRIDLDTKTTQAYDLLLPLLSRQDGRLDETLTHAEGARSRVLLDLLTTGGLGGVEAPLDLVEESRNLKARLARVSTELAQATVDPSRRRELLSTRHALDRALQRQLYQRAVAQKGELRFGEPLDAQGVRALANNVGPIVLYFSLDVELLAFVVLPSGEVTLHFIDVPRTALKEKIDDFLLNFTNPLFERRATSQAKDLWQTLLAPFAEHIPRSGSVILVPHGPLHGLPFEALLEPTSRKRLFELWDVSISPSVSALALARRQRRHDPSLDNNLVAFASGVGLSLTEGDVHAVAAFFPVSQREIFGPDQAEYQVYEEHASKARHLLIASRGVHVQDSRRDTYLEIHPTPGVHDERLAAVEIASIPLQAELVTLVACDTDRGDALLSDERLTLTRSFLIAGAASVLATRWRVPEDRSTTRFLVDFYQAYREGPDGQGLRKDQALTWARRQAIQRGDPAQVWAAWVLVGDAR